MKTSVQLPQSLNCAMWGDALGKSVLQTFIIEDEDNIPAALLEAEQVEFWAGQFVGWCCTDSPEFRCGLEYRVCHD